MDSWKSFRRTIAGPSCRATKSSASRGPRGSLASPPPSRRMPSVRLQIQNGAGAASAPAAAARSRPTTRPSSAVRMYARGRADTKISSSAPQARRSVPSAIGDASDLLQPLLDDLAALDQLALGQRRGLLVHAERALEAAQIERHQPRIESHVAQDLLGVIGGEVAEDPRHLVEQVDVGSEPRRRAVEEDHVLHVEHQVLRELGALLEEPLQQVLDLVHQLLAGHG